MKQLFIVHLICMVVMAFAVPVGAFALLEVVLAHLSNANGPILLDDPMSVLVGSGIAFFAAFVVAAANMAHGVLGVKNKVDAKRNKWR